MDTRYFHEKVAEWYMRCKRDLPWRDTNDPYKVWLSEIILQQTRVNQGLPYYIRFTEKFPTVTALANASEQEVLRLWQGLGYYTRARNLHKCAREVVSLYNGVFPDTFESLKKLPGIGDYTAAAIASFSYKEPVAVVDGNVFRVLARIFGIEKEINSPEGKAHFTRLANELISRQHPDIHNQAVMEFGAMLCTPKNPSCSDCMFRKNCFAAKKDLQHAFPVKKKAKASRMRYFYYLVVRKGNSLLMKKREHKDIWHGLYDFALIEKERATKTDKLIESDDLLKELTRSTTDIEVSGPYKHVLSHQVIISRFIIIGHNSAAPKPSQNLKYYSMKKIADLPKPVLISRFLEDYRFL
jgi:A/G-specific adenine glycosylase